MSRSLAVHHAALALTALAVALIASELGLRAALAAGLVRSDRGFGAFVRQVGDARAMGYATLRSYEADHFQGRPPGLFRPSAHADIGWEPTPNARAGHIRINAAGFRGRDYDLTPPAGVRRVVLLGDSEVFGMSLAEPDTLAGRLEAALVSAGTKCEVLNFGCPGYNTDQELAVLERRALPFHPDTVVLYYCFNDPEISSRRVLTGAGPLSRTHLGLLAAFTLKRFDTIAEMKRGSRDIVAYYKRLHRSRYFADAKAVIERMGGTLKARGIAFHVLIAPELAGYADLRTGYPYAEVHSALAGLAEAGIPVIDPLAALAGETSDPRAFWVRPYDPHKNARANTLIAAYATQKLNPAPDVAPLPSCP